MAQYVRLVRVYVYYIVRPRMVFEEPGVQSKEGVFVPDLVESHVTSAEQVYELMFKVSTRWHEIGQPHLEITGCE